MRKKKNAVKESTKVAAGVAGIVGAVYSIPGVSDVINSTITAHPKVAFYTGLASAILTLFHQPRHTDDEQ